MRRNLSNYKNGLNSVVQPQVINVCNQEIKEMVLNVYFYCPSYISSQIGGRSLFGWILWSRAHGAISTDPLKKKKTYHCDNEMSPLLITHPLSSTQSCLTRTTTAILAERNPEKWRKRETRLHLSSWHFPALNLSRRQIFDIVKNDAHKTHKQHIKINFNKNLRAEKQNQTIRVTTFPLRSSGEHR